MCLRFQASAGRVVLLRNTCANEQHGHCKVCTAAPNSPGSAANVVVRAGHTPRDLSGAVNTRVPQC